MSQTSDMTGSVPARPEVERDWARSAWTTVTWVGLIVLLVWSWAPSEMFRWTYLITDSGNMAKYAACFGHPDFSDWAYYLEEMVLTLQIALWGTFLAAVFAVPFVVATVCTARRRPLRPKPPRRRS